MKKTLIVIALLVAALAVFGVGAAFAQGTQPPAATGYGPGRGGMGGGMMGGGYGLMQNYVEQALAEKLGVTEADVEKALTAGTTMYQIALDKGIKQEDLAAFMSDVHKAAFEKAVAAGVVTQAQADFMLQRMQGAAQNGYVNCPMNGGTATAQTGYGRGGGRGRGGMMGGYQQPQNQP